MNAEARCWPGLLVAAIGKTTAWLTVLMVLITFAVVVLRYALNMGWIWLQESIVYLHAMVFMLTAAWAWQSDDHVRVDIFYREASPRRKALVNALGTLLLLIPLCLFMLFASWDYVSVSWSIKESSREATGLPWVYLLKTLILLAPALLLLQSLCILGQSWQAWRDPAQ